MAAALLLTLSTGPAWAEPPVQDEARPGPAIQPGGGPPEGELTPPPEAEKVPLAPGYIEIDNPAFPPRVLPKAPEAAKGPRLGKGDLTPYFSEGALLSAKLSFDQGDYPSAIQHLSSAPDIFPARYLRALSYSRAGEPAKAAELFTALGVDYPALRDHCQVQAALADEELGQLKSAADLFRQVPPSSKLFADARLGLSRVLRRMGDLPSAKDALRPLSALGAPAWGRDVGAEALIAMADLARAEKDSTSEREALLTLWANHPLSGLSQPAERRLGGHLPIEAKVSRAEQLIEAHRNSSGISLLKPLLPSLELPDALACRAYFALGKALRKERDHRRAILKLAPVVDRCSDPDLRARALYVLASSRSIAEPKKGAATYDRLARDYPAHPFADDALFFAADLYLKEGDSGRALARLSEVANRYPAGDFAAESLFKIFWIEKSKKQIPAALATLDRIEELFDGEAFEVERARYWRARLLQSTQDAGKAIELFAQLASDRPTGYYGFAARERLAELSPAKHEEMVKQLQPPPPSDPWPLSMGPLAEDPHFLAGIELLRMGFLEAASAELTAANRANLPDECLRLLVLVLSVARDARSAHAIARVALKRDLTGKITSKNRSVWEIAYPSAFRSWIEKYCRLASLEPDLLQALIREESALDPKALSWAGALGLTQLMLPTAKYVAKVHHLPPVTRETLLSPEPNIRLGAYYLATLVRQFKGNKYHAVASYNAGALPVRRWIEDRPDRAVDEWVEEIPIAETRGYVKRVLRSYNTYQLLFAAPKLAAEEAPE